MFKTIGIFAHVDAGKTSVAESMLYVTNQVKTKGRVDHQSTVLDYHELERKRGMTIFSDIARFTVENTTFQLVDTPGHFDFAAEMEQSISVLDVAIIVVCGVSGVQSHTKTVYALLQAANIPVVFFVNKMDRKEADLADCLKQLKRLTATTLYINETDEAWIEEVATLDDALLEMFLDTDYDETVWQERMQTLVKRKQLTPVLAGSALTNHGILHLLRTIDKLVVPTYEINDAISGRVFSIRHEQKQPLVFVKLLTGQLHVKDELHLNGHSQAEKIHQMRRYIGSTYEQVNHIEAGEIVALSGLLQATIGDTFGACEKSNTRQLLPTLKVSVSAETLTTSQLLQHLHQLEKENPTLMVEVHSQTKEVFIRVLGIIALEIFEALMLERFNIAVTFGTPQIVYKETILDSVIGSGHYEPLKHYAEVHVKLSPTSRGSGITFDSVAPLEELPRQIQNLIQSHVFNRPLIGVLTGAHVTDLHVTLLTGRHHEKHTSGGDFYEATHRAIRQGLEKATSQLLEPMYEVRMTVLQEQLGRVLTDIQCANGRFDAPDVDETHASITAIVPVATFIDYPKEFASFTKGTGELQFKLAGYEPCHNEANIIAASSYDKQADRDNPSASIFCAKGSGFVVPWEQADDYMHCEVKKYD